VSGESEYVFLSSAPIDLSLPAYYFEITLLSDSPVSVGLCPLIPSASSQAAAMVAQRSEAEARAVAAGQSSRRRHDPSMQQLHQRVQQHLRCRMQPWPLYSVRLDSDGRAVRKLAESDVVQPVCTPFGKAGECVGVFLNLSSNTVTFTRNGELQQNATISLQVGSGSNGGAGGKLYPALSCNQAGTRVSINFGTSPFRWLPPSSSVCESESSRQERLDRAEAAERAALAAAEQERTRREVERVQLEFQRAEAADQLIALTGGLLTTQRQALLALQMHRWDASVAANWLLEDENAAVAAVHKRIREEDAEKAAERARNMQRLAEQRAQQSSTLTMAAASSPISNSTEPSVVPPVATPMHYDYQHSSTLILTPAFPRAYVDMNEWSESDPATEEWLAEMEAVLIGARLEQPELVYSLLQQMRRGGEERANALLSLPANVEFPPPPKPRTRRLLPNQPTRLPLKREEVVIGLMVRVHPHALSSSRGGRKPSAVSTNTAAQRAAALGVSLTCVPISAEMVQPPIRDWIPNMMHLAGRCVTICGIEELDKSQLVRVRWECGTRSLMEEWVLPLSALRHVEDDSERDQFIGLEEMKHVYSRTQVQIQLARMRCRRLLLQLGQQAGSTLLLTIHPQSQSVAQLSVPDSPRLTALMEVIAAECVPLPIPNADFISPSHSLPTFIQQLFEHTLTEKHTFVSSLFQSAARYLSAGTILIDTDTNDRSMLPGDSNSSSSSSNSNPISMGIERPLHSSTTWSDACGIIISFSASTRLIHRQDSVSFWERPDGSIPLGVVGSTHSLMRQMRGGDKPPRSTLQACFLQRTAPDRMLTCTVSKHNSTALRSIRVKLEAAPLPASSFALALSLSTFIVQQSEGSLSTGGSTNVAACTSHGRSAVDSIGSFLLAARIPPLIKQSLFQLLTRSLFTLRSLYTHAPSDLNLPAQALYKELMLMHRTATANSRPAINGRVWRSPPYTLALQHTTRYLQVLTELMATLRLIIGDTHFQKICAVEVQQAKPIASKDTSAILVSPASVTKSIDPTSLNVVVDPVVSVAIPVPSLDSAPSAVVSSSSVPVLSGSVPAPAVPPAASASANVSVSGSVLSSAASRPRREAPPLQVEQLISILGVSVALATAALEQCGSFNSALDAIMAGTVVHPTEEQQPEPQRLSSAAASVVSVSNSDVAAPSQPTAEPSVAANAENAPRSSVPPVDINLHTSVDMHAAEELVQDGGEDEDDALAAAIALSMAAESNANAISPTGSSPAIIDNKPLVVTSDINTPASSESSIDSVLMLTPSSTANGDHATMLLTEVWFDHYFLLLSLVDALSNRSTPLPLSIALAALDLNTVSTTSQPPASISTSASLIMSEHTSNMWSVAHDIELITYANAIEQQQDCRMLSNLQSSTFITDINTLLDKSISLRKEFPLLIGMELQCLQRRLYLLLLLNYLMAGALPLIQLDVSGNDASAPLLSHRLSFLRGYILRCVKLDFLHGVMECTSLDTEVTKQVKPRITVDRLLAANDSNRSLFQQCFDELVSVPTVHLLAPAPVGNPHCAFDVRFQGERALGESGPYRELLTDIAKELQTEPIDTPQSVQCALPLLIPTCNHRVQGGNLRDCWLLNPSCRREADLARINFLGKLLGLCVRTNIKFPIAFPPLVWKQLLDIQPSRTDLEDVDAPFVQSILRPLEDNIGGSSNDSGSDASISAEERFYAHFGDTLTWSTTLSDGSVVELRRNGLHQPVTFSDRSAYARRAEWARLNECSEQLLALKRGLTSVLPIASLALLMPEELEYVIAGVPFVDINLLKRHTQYSNCSESDPHIILFWQVMQEMSQKELIQFLVFTSAQQVR
jgi:hypothetical protein